MSGVTRRGALLAAGALGASLGFPLIARGQAQFRWKCGNIMPADHPLNVRLREASVRIKEQTNGQVEIEVFPSSQLGTDADMLAQLRAGGIDLFAQTGLILSTLVPVAAINGIGFAFPDYPKVWSAMDGALGKHVIAAFAKANLVAFDRMWDNGFRQVLSVAKPVRTPDDLKGMKLRVPPSALWTSMFKALGAAPVSIPWGETYSAMQTKVADGLENPLGGIWFARMHEVGRYISGTNHMWDGFWIVANRKSIEALPPTARDVVARVLNETALKQRADVEKLNGELRTQLTAKGIQFVDVKPDAFRQKLQQSGFYTEWKGRMGPEAWSLLEAAAGKLA
jgi:tripartite ATP-independent transporter DctP family solute receptor